MKDMTPADVRDRVERIRKMTEGDFGDPEGGHIEEDQLMEDVLRQISKGCIDPVALARACLEVFELDFARWYA